MWTWHQELHQIYIVFLLIYSVSIYRPSHLRDPLLLPSEEWYTTSLKMQANINILIVFLNFWQSIYILKFKKNHFIKQLLNKDLL